MEYKKRFLIIVVGGVLVCAFVFVCAYAFGGANNFAQRGVAMIVQSWSGVFDDGSSSDVTISDADQAVATDTASDTNENIFVTRPISQKSPLSGASKPKTLAQNENNNLPNNNSSVEPLATSSFRLLAPSCNFSNALSATPSRKIILNEIAWMGALTSKKEWIEIKNNSTSVVDLSGWQIADASGKLNIAFTNGEKISAGSFFFLANGTSTAFQGAASQKIYSGNLVNTGDTLAIFDPQCGVSDFINASSGWPAGNNTTKQTLERDDDAAGWHTSALPGGTPSAANSPKPVPLSVSISSSAPIVSSGGGGSAVISNVSESSSLPTSSLPNASSTPVNNACSTLPAVPVTSLPSTAGVPSSTASTASVRILIVEAQTGAASTTNDYVRIYNAGSVITDISGWKLRKKSQPGTDSSLRTIPSGTSLAAGQFFLWANSAGGFSETVHADVSSTETIAANNSVALLNASGTIVDALGWGSGTNQYGEGTPYPTSPAAGQLLKRKIADGMFVDTNDNSADFILQ